MADARRQAVYRALRTRGYDREFARRRDGTSDAELDRLLEEAPLPLPCPRELWVLIPTGNGTSMTHTAIMMTEMAMSLPVPHGVYWVERSNIPRSRNALVHSVRNAVGPDRDRAWCLWVDSDILTPTETIPAIRDAIEWSWRTGIGWTAHYPMVNGDSHMIMTKDLPRDFKPNVKREDLDELPDGAKVPMCGFGLLFVPQDLRYDFYTDQWGEDVYYWHDHPEEHVEFRKDVWIQHHKLVYL